MKKVIIIALLLIGTLYPQSAVSSQGSSDNIANTLVRRDASGDFDAGNIKGTTLESNSGTTINEFSIDGTFAGNSDDAVPTEKAVKAYADAIAAAAALAPSGNNNEILTDDGAGAIVSESEFLYDGLDLQLGVDIDDVRPSFKIVGDADTTPADDISETLTFTLIPDAISTNSLWRASTTQGAGFDFDMPLIASTLESDGNVKGTTYGSDGSVTDAELLYINTLSSNAQTQFGGKQPLDGALTSVSGLVYVSPSFIKLTADDTYTVRTFAEVRADLDLEAGTDFYSKSAEDTWRNSVTQTEMGYLNGISSFGSDLIDDADASAGRATLGGTTIGQAIFIKTNPGAITFGRANADNSFDWLSDANFRTAINVDVAGTDNSTDVTLNANATAAGLSLATQEINYRAATNAQTGYATASQITAQEANTSLLNVTPGTATALKALIVDANKDIDLGSGDILATDGTFSGDVDVVSDFTAGTMVSDGIVRATTSVFMIEQTSDLGSIAGQGQFWVKDDTPNIPMFTDDVDVEWKIQVGTSGYGEMYFNANGNVTTIETADTPIALRQFTTGSLSNFTYTVGTTGAVTAYYDRGANVGVHDNTHGLTTGDVISIRGTTNYNGIFSVTVVDADSFYIADTWATDEGASDWDQGDYLTVTNTGTYKLDWDISAAEGGAAGSTLTYAVYINATIENKSRIQRKFANNDVGAFGGHAILALSAGDIVFLTASSSGTNDMTHSYGALALEGI